MNSIIISLPSEPGVEGPADSGLPIRNNLSKKDFLSLYSSDTIIALSNESNEIIAKEIFSWYNETYGNEVIYAFERHKIIFRNVWGMDVTDNEIYLLLEEYIDKLRLME